MAMPELLYLVEEMEVEVVADVAHGAGGEVSGGGAVLELELLVPRRVRPRRRGGPDARTLKR